MGKCDGDREACRICVGMLLAPWSALRVDNKLLGLDLFCAICRRAFRRSLLTS